MGNCLIKKKKPSASSSGRLEYEDEEDEIYFSVQGKFKTVFEKLSDENTDVSEQCSSLDKLCEVLSLSNEGSITYPTASALSPVLVRLAGHGSSPDIMLVSVRAITHLLAVMPGASGLLVRDGVVPALCARLEAIEYMDVAEQCLSTLEKISVEQPVACLEAGAIMAVLSFVDFFSPSVQRVAINTVANVCKKLSSNTSSHFMDAVPILCNLLQYEDEKLVANVVTCLIRIAETVSEFPKMVDQLCEHGLIQQIILLIAAMGSQTSFNQSIYGHLICLLSILASGSANAVKLLLEQNISCILKNMLSSRKASGGDANSNQVYHEVLKLLNVLLPPVECKKSSSKEKVLKDQPELLRRFGIDIVPTLVEVINCGGNLQVCDGCVTIINKLVNSTSRSDILFDILDITNMSSFLAGVFALKDRHVLMSALNIVETILKELPDVFLYSFAKEGVVHAIDAILTGEEFTHSSNNQIISSSSQQNLSANDGVRCLCYNLNIGKPKSSEIGNCKLDKDSIHTLAKHIKETYFAPNIGLTETLQKLRKYSATVNKTVNLSMTDNIVRSDLEEKLIHTLGQMMMELSEVSTFEFIQSGVVKSLLSYFSSGQCLKGKMVEHHGLSDYSLVIMERFAAFASLSLSATSLSWEGTPLAVLVRKLQLALSSLENFPVIINEISKAPRAICAAIPTKRVCLSGTLTVELPYNLHKSDPVHEILCLLKILEVINKSTYHLMSHERVKAFAEGKTDDLDSLAVTVCPVPQSEFVSSKLTEKLEQHMVNPLSVSIQSWCSQLLAKCPFLFSFEVRNKYFLLTAVRPSLVQSYSPSSDSRRPLVGNILRQKFRIPRTLILQSAAEMMDACAQQKVTLEVEYNEEFGTGLGPTLEFYTLVSREFQKLGLGMWREDRNVEPGFVVAPSGLFPRPWSATMESSDGVKFSEVLKRFVLLGQVVAKALQEGRVLDLPLSKAFYKLALLDQDLNVHDIQSFDPALGKVLLEFQALVDRKNILNSSPISHLRTTKIEDLCLDFTLPGYPDYLLTPTEFTLPGCPESPDCLLTTSRQDHRMVNAFNLEEYVSLIVDATLKSGIKRQVEAFRSGFNQVFPITSLGVFTGEEIDRLLCGERDAWTSNELSDHIQFDHGYTASSPPVIYLLEIMKELQRDQQQAFIQFVTGAPRLPYGGLAALDPKMTIVCKQNSNALADEDLPSVMTCAHYLKLPRYSTKDIMKERLLYAITEGQGSFHLS